MIILKKIRVSELVEGMISDQTICDERGKILISKGIALTNSIITRLQNFDVSYIYIQAEDDKAREVNLIADTIYEYRIINIKDHLSKIEDILYPVFEVPDVKKIVDILAKDEKLLNHSLRVAVLSLNAALKKRYSNERLTTLAIGALLHDCGMKKFTEDDTEHPIIGYGIINNNQSLSMEVALICLQHHERYNGSGFPFAFRRTQIAEFAFLVAIADYYDRLLIKNSNPKKAFFQTVEKKGIFFEPGIIDLFASTIDWSRFYNIK